MSEHDWLMALLGALIGTYLGQITLALFREQITSGMDRLLHRKRDDL